MPNGTGFVNWDDYFSLNQKSAQQTADQLRGNLQGQAASAKLGADNASNALAGAAQAGVQTTQPNKPVKGSTGPIQAGGTPTMNPDGTAQKTPNDTYQDARGNWQGNQYSYTGPSGYTDEQLAGVKGQYDQAQNAINATGSLAGLQANLQNMYGSSVGYGQRASAYDAALTGQAGGEQLAALRQKYHDLFNPQAFADAGKATTDAEAKLVQTKQTRANYDAGQQNAAVQKGLGQGGLGPDGSPRGNPKDETGEAAILGDRSSARGGDVPLPQAPGDPDVDFWEKLYAASKF